MKYNKNSFSAELMGVRYGEQWAGGIGWAEFSQVVISDLKQTVKRVCSPDFQDGQLTPDSIVKITLFKANRRTVRYFDVTLFSSIAGYVGDKESYELREGV